MMYYVIENGTLVFHKTHDWDEARAVARAEWERWGGYKDGLKSIDIREYEDGFDPMVDSDMDYESVPWSMWFCDPNDEEKGGWTFEEALKATDSEVIMEMDVEDGCIWQHYDRNGKIVFDYE